MIIAVAMPQLAQIMAEGKIVAWRKQVGDWVQRGEILLEVESDKAIIEVEAFASGYVRLLLGQVDQTIPSGQTIAYLADRPDEPLPAGSGALGADAITGLAAPMKAARQDAQTGEISLSPEMAPSREVSPVARRLAKELGIDLAQVQGTGPGGRIRQEDVRQYAERARAPAALEKAAAAEVAMEIIPLSPMRRAIAQRLEESVRKIPHFFLTVEVEMTPAATLRAQWASGHGPAARPPSYTSILVNTVAKILPDHPYLNAAFTEGGIGLYKEINIGVAVAVEDGLIVPVIHRADQRSLAEIEASLTQLQESARAGKFEAAQLQGGTFTISNLGMYGIDECTSLINPPQSAILAAGQVAKRPVVRDDAIVALPTMILTLSADHRVLDGASAARFLADIKVALERPTPP